jgi:hypothetical protein
MKLVPLCVCIYCVFIFIYISLIFKLVNLKVKNSSKWCFRLNRFKLCLSSQLRSESIHCGALILLYVSFLLSPHMIKLNTKVHHLFYPYGIVVCYESSKLKGPRGVGQSVMECVVKPLCVVKVTGSKPAGTKKSNHVKGWCGSGRLVRSPG